MKTTTIETPINRKIIVNTFGKGSSVDLDVNDTARCPDNGKRVYSMLLPEEATQLASALAGENATVVTDLPEAKLKHGYVVADCYSRSVHQPVDDLLENAKALLAIHAFLVKRNAEQEAAKAAEAEAVKAKEAANAKRRDELATELVGAHCKYSSRSLSLRMAIDHIIELEEAATVS